MPTDDVSALARLREKLAGMTPGKWDVGQSMAGPVWLYAFEDTRDVNDIVRIGSLEITPHEQDDAEGICISVSLARFVADEGTEGQHGEALYVAFWARQPRKANGEPPDVVPWSEQAEAIRTMWTGIASDSLALIASAGEEA